MIVVLSALEKGPLCVRVYVCLPTYSSSGPVGLSAFFTPSRRRTPVGSEPPGPRPGVYPSQSSGSCIVGSLSAATIELLMCVACVPWGRLWLPEPTRYQYCATHSAGNSRIDVVLHLLADFCCGCQSPSRVYQHHPPAYDGFQQ